MSTGYRIAEQIPRECAGRFPPHATLVLDGMAWGAQRLGRDGTTGSHGTCVPRLLNFGAWHSAIPPSLRGEWRIGGIGKVSDLGRGGMDPLGVVRFNPPSLRGEWHG